MVIFLSKKQELSIKLIKKINTIFVMMFGKHPCRLPNIYFGSDMSYLLSVFV